MNIGRSIATQIAVHNALKTGVHGVGEKYLAISSGSDQLITNADVALLAAILYAKLTLTGSIRNVDIHTAAAIVYSKLALTGKIKAADIEAAAGIPLTKLESDVCSQLEAVNYVIAHKNLITGIHGYQMVHKTANQTVNDSEALVNVTDLVFAVGISEVWEFFLLFRNISVSDTPDMDIAFTIPNLATLVHRYDDIGTVTDGTAEFDVTASSLETWKRLNYVYIGGANAGNLQLQFAQHTATAENTTILANAFIIAHQLA